MKPFTRCEACGAPAEQTAVKRLGRLFTRPMRLCRDCARPARRVLGKVVAA